MTAIRFGRDWRSTGAMRACFPIGEIGQTRTLDFVPQIGHPRAGKRELEKTVPESDYTEHGGTRRPHCEIARAAMPWPANAHQRRRPPPRQHVERSPRGTGSAHLAFRLRHRSGTRRARRIRPADCSRPLSSENPSRGQALRSSPVSEGLPREYHLPSIQA